MQGSPIERTIRIVGRAMGIRESGNGNPESGDTILVFAHPSDETGMMSREYGIAASDDGRRVLVAG